MAEASTTSILIPAATVVVVRDGSAGLEVLMLKRAPGGSFSNFWVFPGGKVDPDDRRDDDGEDFLATYRRTAAREATEEAGIKIAAHTMQTFSYWEPPPTTPKRFGTWFFLAPATAGKVTVDGAEIEHHLWLAPAEVLTRRDNGEGELAPPTWVTLYELAGFNDVATLLAVDRPNPPRYSTRHGKLDNMLHMLWAGDAGYEQADPSLPGERHRLVMDPAGWHYRGPLARSS